MKIHVIRHGQTIWNEERRMQGSKDSPLTEKGIEEAKKLHKLIREMDIEKIYTSPLGRTLETTHYIKGDLDIPVKIIDDLQEMDFGHLEGKFLDEVEEEYPDLIRALWNDPVNYRNETGENYEQLYKRVDRALKEIIKEDYKEVAVVTHGIVICALISIVKGKGIKGIWERPVVKNTSRSTFKLKDRESLDLILEGDISHL